MESIIPYDGKENSSVKHNGTFKTIHETGIGKNLDTREPDRC